jgi:hypothetical protein
LPPVEHRRATGKHATASAPVTVTTRAALARTGQVEMAMGQANNARPMGRSQPSTVQRLFRFSVFHYIPENWYKLQKIVENTILLEKIWNKFL